MIILEYLKYRIKDYKNSWCILSYSGWIKLASLSELLSRVPNYNKPMGLKAFKEFRRYHHTHE